MKKLIKLKWFQLGTIGALLLGTNTVLSAAISVDGKMAAKVAATNPKLSPVAIKKAFQYLAAHDDVFKNKDYMSIVNFDQPSNEKRLYVINLKTGDSEKYFVSHGKNTSAKGDRAMAEYFSNTNNSKKSSLGFYRTLDKNEEANIINSDGIKYRSTGIYSGKHGRSLRMKGLQSTNSNALNREIVIHGAAYASPAFIKTKGRLGESWGCPAVDLKVRDTIMNQIEGRSLHYIFKSIERVSAKKSEPLDSTRAQKAKSSPKSGAQKIGQTPKISATKKINNNSRK